jgi:hypothetical protein
MSANDKREAAATAVCANPDCNERFAVPRHSGRYQRTSKRRIKSARYCSPSCRQAVYIARRAIRAGVPHSERHRAFRGARTSVTQSADSTNVRTSVTHALQDIDFTSKNRGQKTSPGWHFVWCERLDGSLDLYCDTDVTSRQLARVVRRDGRYRLSEPSDLPPLEWATKKAAQQAVCKLVAAQ